MSSSGYFTQLSENFAVSGYSMGGEVIIALFKIRADGSFITLESHCAYKTTLLHKIGRFFDQS